MSSTFSKLLMKKKGLCHLSILCFLLSPGILLAQITTATIVGTVSDESAAVIPGAEVTIRRVETNEIFVAVTNDSGDYRVVGLPVGNYQIEVALPGFKTQRQSGVKLDVGRILRIDLVLTVGEVTESVEVSAITPLLVSEKPEFSQVIDLKKVEGLPINNRDFTQLAILTTGTVPRHGEVNANFGMFNTRGMRRTDNMVYIDGTMFAHGNGSTFFRPSIDAFQEFEIKTGLYGPEYGIKPGAQVNAVLKSGTNDLHGNLFWFHRNDNLDARNFFESEKGEFKRNQFGGTVGGPIYIPGLINGQDKAWFFFSYQKETIRQLVPRTGIVPTTAEKAGQFSSSIVDPLTGQSFPDNTIPTERINPIAAFLQTFYPAPNTTGALNFTSASVRDPDNPQFITKVNVNASERRKFSGHFIWDRFPGISINTINAFTSKADLTGRMSKIGWTETFGPSIINEASIHNIYRSQPLGPSNPKPEAAQALADLGITELLKNPGAANGVPTTNLSAGGFLNLGDVCCSGHFAFGNWQVKDQVSWVKNNHSLKIGWEYRRYYIHPFEEKRPRFNFDGRYTGNTYADFLLGFPFRTESTGQESVYNLRHNNHYFYLGDDWKVNPKLTLNLGVRYEWRLSWRDKRGHSTNVDPATGEFVPALLPADQQPHLDKLVYTFNAPLLSYKKLDGILPRLGLAYRLTKDTVIRVGTGIYSSEVLHSTGLRLALNPKPGTEINIFDADRDFPTLSLSDPFPTGAAAPPGIPRRFGQETVENGSLSGTFPLTRSYSWGLSVQHALAPDLMVDVGYQGNRMINQVNMNEWNDARPGTGDRQARRPFPNLQSVLFLTGNGDAWYNALEIKLEKRTGIEGLYTLAAFTWSKALDTANGFQSQSGLSGTRSRNQPYNLDKSFSEAHVGRRFVLASGYDLPFGEGRPFLQTGGPAAKLLQGWSVQGILSAQDGQYFTANLPGDRLDTGSSRSQRPDLIRDPNFSSSRQTRTQWFDTGAFEVPAQLVYGNSPRAGVRGPGLFNIDLGIHRDFLVGERHRVTFRFEMFNAANHTNFRRPGNNFGTGSFGVVGSAIASRQLQFGLKYFF